MHAEIATARGENPVMSISSTRISISGGGTDLLGNVMNYGGSVVNIAVDQYATVVVDRNRDPRMINVFYDRHMTEAENAKLLRHRPSAEALFRAKVDTGVVIRYLNSTSTDSGQGLRGALHVSVLHAAYAYAGKQVSKEELASGAVEISRVVDMAGGVQDEYAAAFGGVNFWDIQKGGRVIRKQLELRGTALQAFMNCTTVFYSDARGDYSILTAEMARLDRKVEDFHRLASLARMTPEPLLNGNMEAVGKILDEDWRIKESLDPAVATPKVRQVDALLRKEGVWGMKVMGPGGGGSVIVMHPEEKREKVIRVMRDAGFTHFDFRIDWEGSRVVRARKVEA